MSIRSLTNGDLARRFPEGATRAKEQGELAIVESSKQSEKKAPDANDAIDVIMKYIPTEAIALYIAALPILSSLNSAELP